MTPARRAVLLAAIGGLALAAGYGAHRWRVSGSTAEAGRLLWQGRWPDLEGRVRTLGEFRGRVLILNYWATWCAPCREEIPRFVRLDRELGSKGVQFVGIAIDQVDKVRQFAKELDIGYPLLLGGMEALDQTRGLGNAATVLPFTVVFDRSGKIAESLAGDVSEARLRQWLASLI